MSGDFAALIGSTDSLAPTGDYEIVDSIFEWARRLDAEQERQVGLVLTKKQLSRAIDAPARGSFAWRECEHIGHASLAQPRTIRGAVPRPRVARPKLGQNMEHSRFLSCVLDRDQHQDVIGIRLRKFNCNVEEPSAAENLLIPGEAAHQNEVMSPAVTE